MILKIFTVYDSKAEAFLQPFMFNSAGQALRAFVDSVNDSNHQFARHPEDFTLFELGTYDDNGAKFDLLDSPKSLGLALEFVSKEV